MKQQPAAPVHAVGSSVREIHTKPPHPVCAQHSAPHCTDVFAGTHPRSPPGMSKPGLIVPTVHAAAGAAAATAAEGATNGAPARPPVSELDACGACCQR